MMPADRERGKFQTAAGPALSAPADGSESRSPSGRVVARTPCRILHVVPSLERGGIEMWLMQMRRSADAARYAMDFLVLHREAGELAPEARSLGCQVVTSPEPQRPWKVWRDFATMLRAHGPYDVVHGHVHHYSGLILLVAACYGVPCRVAHSHTDTRVVEQHARWPRRCYLALMKQGIRRFATRRIAVSRSAAEDLFGSDWAADRRCVVIPCGIDLPAFRGAGRRLETRWALGLPEDSLVIGHVGRFHQPKNHGFLLEIAAEVFARDKHARLLLVGDGELLPEVQSRAMALGIAGRVVFAGARADVAALMQAMDVFVFPSHFEGLGLVLIEAQATGLPCVLSEGLPREIDVVPGLIHRLPLTEPAAAWASAALQAASAPHETADRAFQAICQSDFSAERSAANVLRVYEQAG
jgi:glycosyltransferase involved in cell wall biosynthesis